MSTTAIDYRATSVARTTAQRAAEGVVAAYIHALSSSSAEPVDAEPTDQRLAGRIRARACETGRSNRSARAGAVSIRRHPARRRALLPA